MIPALLRHCNNLPTTLFMSDSNPSRKLLPGDNLFNLLQSIYFDILASASDPDYFVERCILTPKNKHVKVINDKLFDAIVGRKVTYLSHNRIWEDKSAIVMSAGILSTIDGGSSPPHQLELKVGSPIMILRNIDPTAGLCNGTRLIVNSLGTNIIEATIATGPKKGDIALIPRIRFITAATKGMCPVGFQRTQFPVRLSINRAQDQTLDSIGLYPPYHAFWS